MAIDTSAISNVGEFYSNHYLDAILDKDVKSLIKSWEEAEGNGYVAPHKRLSAQAAKYFKLKSQLTHSVDQEEQYRISHEVNVTLLEALGYDYQSNAYELSSEEGLIPVLCSLKKDGNPYLWIIDTYWDLSEDARLFDQKLLGVQKPADTDAYQLQAEMLENIPALIFKKDEPPRWLLILSGGRAVLIERHKWGQGQYLEFDLDEIMARKNVDNFKALAILLSKEALLPDESNAIHDTLDENSHKHAYAVSSDLKYGIRRAVELLANEYVWYVTNVQQGKGLKKEGLDKQLTSETLTYMYRLLFLFYAEARSGDLGLLPMNSDEYRMGYSIESLRDLEQVKLNTEKAKSGYYLHESLEKLFKLINDGHTPTQLELSSTETVEYGSTQTGVFGRGEVAQGRLKMSPNAPKAKVEKQYTDYEFSIEALGSPLFDPAKTPLLSKAKYRNVVLQEIIQLLSLSKEGRGRKSGRGRISYAQLGINQLGAVYEGLLSYTGFFAKETLYEVKKVDDKSEDENRQAYFIPESEIDKYHEDEFVRIKESDNPNATAKRVKYEKGTFIYRLAGRDREKSASYYTPEVLTKAVVKYSLKELLKGKKADEILKLTVCEPAMGSGAFLNEAVNQLAEAYLREKQKELEKDIPPADYQEELQKVKAYIATHNCYGVDLNPTAVDLAKVSLWLNIIYKHSKTPWFNLRLSSGNSLIGARLEVFKSADLKTKRSTDTPNYLDKVPQKVDLKAGRAEDEIYHFFVPDLGMAGFDKDKVIKGLLPDEISKIKEWRKSFTKEFTDAQIQTLRRLSDKVDELLSSHLELRQKLLRETTDDIPVWPAKGKPTGSSIHVKEKLEQELYEGSSSYRKLKLVMDYWCSLWFWPIEKARLLPTRDQFIRDCELILEGKTSGRGEVSHQTGLAFKPIGENEIAEAENIHKYGIDDITQESIRLEVVCSISKSTPYMHWEIQYWEIFKARGGFDLIVGNPPWVEVHWDEKAVIGDYDALIPIRKVSSSELKKTTLSVLESEDIKKQYLHEFCLIHGMKTHLTSPTNFNFKTSKNNLFKAFIIRAWSLNSKNGFTGFLNYEGIYNDPRATLLRKECYLRLRYHFHFQNELGLFSDVMHNKKYEINIYGPVQDTPSFSTISNLFHPVTIDESFSHDQQGLVPGLKNSHNSWETRGHGKRIVEISQVQLEFFNTMMNSDVSAHDNHLTAQLPLIHSAEVFIFLEKFKNYPHKLSDIHQGVYKSTGWNETLAQEDGSIERITYFPDSISNIIYSGPHIYVADPYYKTPREICETHLAYDEIDSTNIPLHYLPRVNYKMGEPPNITEDNMGLPWDASDSMFNNYRLLFRAMIAPHAEKTLIGAIIPPQAKHINSTHSYTFKSTEDLILFSGACASVAYDCYLKILGKQNLHNLPFQLPKLRELSDEIALRCLLLNCLTDFYMTLWEENWKDSMKGDSWTKSDARLMDISLLEKRWSPGNALKNDFERRWALVELDVLVAISLGLSFDTLVTVYRIYCPTLVQNESDTWYDQNGRTVFTANRGLPGTGVSRKEWEHIRDLQSGVFERTIIDDTQAMGSVERTIRYVAPFERCDRETDYRKAWAEFQNRLGSV